MVDENYAKAMTEVNYILENTDEKLVQKIPKKMIEFIKNNINEDYEVIFEEEKQLSNQKLLPETEDILSLIYRSYWATEQEKLELAKKDKEELERKLEEQDIQKIWEEKRINKQTQKENIEKEETQLIPEKKKSILRKILEKIKNIFSKTTKSKFN